MPSLISKASGNLTASTTWNLVDATSLLDSEAGNTALTTSYVESAAFTPGAITIDGIAVKLAARAASPTGTISVRLAQGGATVPGTEITINVSDLPTCSASANEGGWILFKFASPVTLAAATAYTVSAKCSVASESTLYRNATAGNWSRMLRTTTEQAPAAGDQLDIMGEHTGAGTGNDFTVTMNSTATTDYGSGTDGAVALSISKRGTLNYAYAAATNHYLKCSGNVIVYNGGTFTIGTVANPIPRDGTAVLEFDPVADGGMGLIVRNGGTFTAQGLSRTAGKNIVSCKLNTDEAAGQTVLGVDTDTGWLANDEIAIASTSQTASQSERRTLSINASATELTITAGLTNAHSGTSPTQAEIILLTRNVIIRAATSNIMSYVYIQGATATVDIDWVEFYYLGENTTGKRGIEISVTTGSCNIQYSSVHNGEDGGIYASLPTLNNLTLSNIGCYNVPTVATIIAAIQINLPTSGTSLTFSNITVIYAPNYYGFDCSDVGGIISNITVAGSDEGIDITERAGTINSISNLTAHSCTGIGMMLEGIGTISNIECWRNSVGFSWYGQYWSFLIFSLTISNANLFGNSTQNIRMGGDNNSTPNSSWWNIFQNLTFNNCTFSGDSTFATPYGIFLISDIGAGGYKGRSLFMNLYFKSCTFGTAIGIKVAHSTADIAADSSFDLWKGKIYFNNCKLDSTTEFDSIFLNNMDIFASIHSSKHDQTAGLHKSWFKYGVIQSDTTIRDGASGASQRLTPNNATNKLESGSKKVAVANGNTVTVSVKVRESVAGDGTDYNGNRIRLIVKRNDAMGITADTVLATATVNSEGAFETIQGTTIAVTDDGVLEFVVDCDGTTGWVNVDTWATS